MRAGKDCGGDDSLVSQSAMVPLQQPVLALSGSGMIHVSRNCHFLYWPITVSSNQPITLYTPGRIMAPFTSAVPGRVQRFRVLRRGPTYLYLAWDPPDVVNGILTGFTIVHQGRRWRSLPSDHQGRLREERV